MLNENGSEVETITPTNENRNISESAKNAPALTSENLRNFSQTNPVGGLTSRKNRKVSSSLSPQTYISANEHISNLLQSKMHSGSTSDMSVSSVDSSLVSPLNRRKRTISANLGEVDMTSKGSMSRSSSTLSLASTGVAPLDTVLKKLREGLCGQVFSGWYTERRYIDPIERYKDVVLVDAEESQVVKHVKYAIRKSNKLLGENTFIGLSCLENECRLYVNLGATTSVAQFPFGHFWFQIRQVTFLPNVGYCLELFVIRQFLKTDGENCWKCRQREMESQEKQEPVKLDSVGSALLDIRCRLEGVWKEALAEYWHPAEAPKKIIPYLSKENLVKVVKLVCVLMMAAVAGVVAGMKHGANFLLKTLHELAFLVERSTPLALGTLNILSKVVGGFYLLVAMIWRDSRTSNNTKNKPMPGTSMPPQPALQGPRGSPTYRPSSSSSMFNRTGPNPIQSPPISAMDNMYSSHRNY